MSLASLLTMTGSFERPTITQDDSLGSLRTFSAISGATDLPCLVQPLSHQVKAALGTRKINASHRVWLLEKPVIQVGDRFQQEQSDSAEPLYYILQSLPLNTAGQSRLYEMYVQEQS